MSLSVSISLQPGSNRFVDGSTVTVQARFVDASSGAATDVTDPAILIRAPDGSNSVVSGVSITRVTTGTYTAALFCNTVGAWNVTAQCTTPSAATAAAEFDVVAADGITGATFPPFNPSPTLAYARSVEGLPDATGLTGTENIVVLQGDNPLQASLASLAPAIIAAVPSQVQGYPVGGGFWVGLDGAIRAAPVADMTRYTYPNTAAFLLLTDDL